MSSIVASIKKEGIAEVVRAYSATEWPFVRMNRVTAEAMPNPPELIELRELFPSQLKTLSLSLKEDSLKLVRIDQVFSDTNDSAHSLAEVEEQFFGQFQRVIPPFADMWLEGFDHYGGGSTAAYLVRSSKADQFRISGYTFLRAPDDQSIVGYSAFYWDTDANGVLVECDCCIMSSRFKAFWAWGRAAFHLLTLLHSVQRMNCANAELVLSDKLAVKSGGKSSRVPRGIRWHEIKISTVNRLAVTRGLQHESGHKIISFHSVRGHYADYTQGNGLFGNPTLKKLFWISDHARGDKEIGEVKASYRIVGPK